MTENDKNLLIIFRFKFLHLLHQVHISYAGNLFLTTYKQRENINEQTQLIIITAYKPLGSKALGLCFTPIFNTALMRLERSKQCCLQLTAYYM